MQAARLDRARRGPRSTPTKVNASMSIPDQKWTMTAKWGRRGGLGVAALLGLLLTAVIASPAWAVGSWYNVNLASPRTLVQRWNGSAWSEVPTAPLGGSGGNNLFHGVAGTASDQVWAVGYQSTGGGPQPLAQRWNGTSFVNETLPALALGGTLYAAAATTGPTVFAAGTRLDLVNGSMTDAPCPSAASGS
jgi:hypothetical protein